MHSYYSNSLLELGKVGKKWRVSLCKNVFKVCGRWSQGLLRSGFLQFVIESSSQQQQLMHSFRGISMHLECLWTELGVPLLTPTPGSSQGSLAQSLPLSRKQSWGISALLGHIVMKFRGVPSLCQTQPHCPVLSVHCKERDNISISSWGSQTKK